MSLACIFLCLIASFSVLEMHPSLCMRFEKSSARSLFVLKDLKRLAYFFLRLIERLSRWNVSVTRSYLIFLSSGESVPKLDRWLTSISQGFKLASIMISSPRI